MDEICNVFQTSSVVDFHLVRVGLCGCSGLTALYFTCVKTEAEVESWWELGTEFFNPPIPPLVSLHFAFSHTGHLLKKVPKLLSTGKKTNKLLSRWLWTNREPELYLLFKINYIPNKFSLEKQSIAKLEKDTAIKIKDGRGCRSQDIFSVLGQEADSDLSPLSRS